MSSVFEGYHSVLGKSCKKNPICPSRLLASTVIFKLWAKIYSQYLCIPGSSNSWDKWQNSDLNKSEAIILSTSFENTTCQGIRHETEAYHNGIAFQD